MEMASPESLHEQAEAANIDAVMPHNIVDLNHSALCKTLEILVISLSPQTAQFHRHWPDLLQ
jgi:hypothetical protein